MADSGRAERVGEASFAWRWTRAIAISVWLLGCGAQPEADGDSSEVAPASSAGRSASPAGAGTGQQAAAAAPRVGPQAAPLIAPQIPRTRPGHDAVAATVDPAHASDPWPSELLAEAAELFLERLVRRAYAGDTGGLRGMVTRDITGTIAPKTSEPLVGDALWANLQRLLTITRLPASDVVIEVDVLSVTAPALGGPTGEGAAEGRTLARVRLGTPPESTMVPARTEQTLLVDVGWKLGKRSRVASFDVRSLRRYTHPEPFRDVTDAVLDMHGGPPLGSVLGLGALEAVGRTDRLSPSGDVYLAMHGMAVGDLDGDGWDDLVVGRAAGQPNLLFMNVQGRFVEESAARGLDLLDDTGGLLIVDLDGDGARDVVFGRGGDVVVAWNEGGGTFASFEVLSKDGGDRVYSIVAADVDRDGDLDLYDTRYFASGGYGAQAPTPYHDAMNGAPNVFWRNLLIDGAGDQQWPRRFRDDTAAVGLDAINDRFSLAATFDDFDGDGDLDLYVTNDFGRNSLYLWQGARFTVAEDAIGLVDKAAGMGVSVADVDLDGLSDLVVSNMHSAAGMRVTREERFGVGLDPETRAEFQRHARGNSLFRGVEGRRFEDVTDRAGTGPGGWAWGARFVDWNRDGLVDMVVPNGFLSGRRGPDLQSFFWRRVVGASPMSADAPGAVQDRYLMGWSVISHLSQFERQHWNANERTVSYLNEGDFRFQDVTLATGLGFADDGRALVPIDYDQDGRLDLVFRNRTSPILRVFQGVVEGGAWLSVRLEDRAPNRDAIGALVTVTAGGIPRSQRVRAGDGFLGGAAAELFFGLGEAESVDGVRVVWPDGGAQSFETRPLGDELIGGAWVLRRGADRSGDAVDSSGSNSGGEALGIRHRGRAPRPALSEPPPAPRPGATPGPPCERVPLFEEFPLGAWRLPTFDGKALRIDETSGKRGTLVVLWSVAEPDSAEALRTLAAARPEFEAAGLRVHALSLDGVRDEERARDLAGSVGWNSPGGRLDRSGRIVLDLILARTLAPFDELPLPLCLLFDAEGDLAVLRVGGLGAGEALGDARTLAARADPNDTEPILGGRWLSGRPARPLDDVPDKLDKLGLTELADHLRARRPR